MTGKEDVVKVEIEISAKAEEILRMLREGTGYGTDGMVMQECLFAIKELIDIDSKNTQSTEVRGVLSSFTRFCRELKG